MQPDQMTPEGAQAADWRLAPRLKDMPAVLAGPIVRHVSARTVTVWLALKQADTVTLNIYDTADASTPPVATGSLATVAVGANLHIVAVTATVVPLHPELGGGVVYYYDVVLGDGRRLADQGVVSGLDDKAARQAVLAFGTDAMPSFALPPADLSRLRILHGSCRKPHGENRDGLAAAHHLIETSYWAQSPSDPWALIRPHLLMCTGDQIYADDVADTMLAMCTDFGETLLGWPTPEALPGFSPPRTPASLAPGARSAPVTDVGGFTGSMVDKPALAKSHLIGLGEYLAMYLLVWSPVLWPQTLPTSTAEYDATERKWVELLRGTLPQVRRALANVIVYMCMDDHEVTDDWNLNREWCRRVWGEVNETTHGEPKALGKRIVTNALIAYSVYQMWGNTPERYTGGQPGAQVLAKIPQWTGQTPQQPVMDEMATLLGVPTGKLPAASGGVAQLPRAANALRYDYVLTWPDCPIELVVTDPRTYRTFDPGPMEPPGIMSDAAIIEQIPVRDPAPYLSVVVIPGPVLGVPWIEEKQEERTPERIWGNDAEAWGLRPKTFHRILGRLARRPRVLVLSGDVHYAFTITAGLWASQPYGESAPLATPAVSAMGQLTASAFKNETNSVLDLTTDKLNGGGWNVLPLGIPVAGALAHNPDDWAGWPTPVGAWAPRSGGDTTVGGRLARWPAVINVTEEKKRPHIYTPEHWRYRFTYLTGKRETPTVIAPVTRPPAAAPKATVASWFGSVGHAAGEAWVGDNGTELLGENNLGEIRFAKGASTATAALPVSHLLWWETNASGVPSYSTTFTFTLDPTDTTAIPGRVWEQKP